MSAEKYLVPDAFSSPNIYYLKWVVSGLSCRNIITGFTLHIDNMIRPCLWTITNLVICNTRIQRKNDLANIA